VGRYKVEAFPGRIQLTDAAELNLDVDQSVRLDFALKPAPSPNHRSERRGRATGIQKHQCRTSRVDKPSWKCRVNDANYLNLATLAAGNVTLGGRPHHTRRGLRRPGGAHSYQMNIMVDGLDNNTNYSGGPVGFEAQAVKPSIDAVGEFKWSPTTSRPNMAAAMAAPCW